MTDDADAPGRRRELFMLKTEVMSLLRGFHPPRPPLTAAQLRARADAWPQPRPFTFQTRRPAQRRAR